MPSSRAAPYSLQEQAVPVVLTSTTPLSGLVTSPQNEAQTSTTFNLAAQLTGGCGTPCSATTYNGVTFQYRIGTSGTFANIPASDVSNGGVAVTWPVATNELSDGSGVNTPNLTWFAMHTLATSGLLQVQAQFTDGLGDSYTTSPVTVTIDTTGTGGDFASTQIGPVTVGLQSGNMSLSATDVSIAGFEMGLSVSRTFNSLAPGIASLFGPGWASSFPVLGSSMVWSSVIDDNSYAVLTDSSGTTYSFAAGTPSGGVTPYTAQGTADTLGLTLTKSASGFTLADPTGSQTQFAAVNANTPTYYTPSQVTESDNSQSTGYIYDVTPGDASYGDPLLMVGPNANLPSGTSSTSACPYPPSSATWANGCRALKFTYNTGGDLTQVDFVYQQSGALTDVPVADYSYDSSGRLAQEWDPRFTPNLVTTYTYDENSADANYGRLTSYSPEQSTLGSLAPWTFTYNTDTSSPDYGKLISVSRAHSVGGTATQTLDYEVPLTTSAGGPVDMDTTTVDTWNQTDVPTSAVAVFPGTHIPSTPPSASDWQYAQISYFDANGHEVNTVTHNSDTWDIATTQYDGFGDVISQLTPADRAEALAADSNSASVAAELETVNDYTQSSDGAELLDHTYGPLHNASVPGQGTEAVRDEAHNLYDQNAPAGGPFDLLTEKSAKASIGAGIPGASEADVRETDYVYNNGTDNIGWTTRQPLQIIQSPNSGIGLKITKTSAYNENPNLYAGDPLLTKTCMPSDTLCSGAGTVQYVYYTGGANPVDASCGNHAMWANLVCKTEPAAQPGTPGLPSLPVTTFTYNVYDQPLTKTETFGSSSRTTSMTYNSLQELFNTTITTSGSGMGATVQQMGDRYSSVTGLLAKQETLDTAGNVTALVSYGYDDFGQMSSYTDAANNETSYGYDLAGHVTSRDDGKGTVSISYNAGGLPTSQIDSLAGTFTATYTPDGNVASETYPGGLTANYGYDETDIPTSLSFAGESWTSPLTEGTVPDAHGDVTNQGIADTGLALASSQAFSYDKDGRLSSAQDTEGGQCTTRTYAYDVDSNRTSLATAPPGVGGICQITNPTNQNYTYDTADRVINSGYAYDTLGDITATPSTDAGSNGALSATYYANSMLASQTQNGATITWQLDPTEQRFASFTQNGVTYTNHYSDGTSKVTWVSGSDGSWARYTTDFNGMLAAQATASGVTLELPDLHGDVLATASASPSSTGPASTEVYNEFGVPETGATGTYQWLGGAEISAAALGGQLLMGARAYNPNTGRFSQTDPVPGGSANAYDYSAQNPVTQEDLSGEGYNAIYSWNHYYWLGLTGVVVKTVELFLNNYYTTLLVKGIAYGAGAAWMCERIALKFAETGVGAVVAEACGDLAAFGAMTATLIDLINYEGGNHGVYFVAYLWAWAWRWWWFGWHKGHGGWHFGGGWMWHQ
jgi:RHS repeat-associated protein